MACAKPGCRRIDDPVGLVIGLRSAGHRAGVLAALENRSSGDESGLVTLDTLDEAATAGRHVVDQLGLVEPQAIEVDQVTSARSPGESRPRSEKPKKSAVSLVWRLTGLRGRRQGSDSVSVRSAPWRSRVSAAELHHFGMVADASSDIASSSRLQEQRTRHAHGPRHLKCPRVNGLKSPGALRASPA
jgi:hypothetical protein